jgi:parvulin-like peptidyl-prolyl isomerase
MHEEPHGSVGSTAEASVNSSLPVKKTLPKRTFIFGLGGAVLLAIVLGAWFGKGLVVAATVNGAPISRLSVMKELEKQSGKAALESLIRKKLIDDEVRGKNISVSKDEIDQEIKKIETQVALQGGTLNDVLQQQGMTEGQLREQIEVQKKIEKLLGDKVSVSDAEVEAYIAKNKIEFPKDKQPEEAKAGLREQLKQQKFQQEAQGWISDLTTKAKIQYYVNY